MKKKRKQYTPAEKVAILRKHLIEKVPVSDICDEYSLQPTVFYRWQKAFFEHGAVVFERAGDSQATQFRRQIATLEEKLTKKNEVLSEVMEEYVALKKTSGVH
jgi:transposase-like protein